jgi:integrase
VPDPDEALYPLWWLIALRGLRRGEAAGLRWNDVDLDSRQLTGAGRAAAGRAGEVGRRRTRLLRIAMSSG